MKLILFCCRTSFFVSRTEGRRQEAMLSIGAPSSPLISNFIMYFFDEKIQNICKENNTLYTRYADDLTFSTNVKNLLFEFPNIVAAILEEETQGQIKINNKKTVFSSKAHNR